MTKNQTGTKTSPIKVSGSRPRITRETPKKTKTIQHIGAPKGIL
jgi:hypothetical protein